jgi:S-adenosylmethionine-diacylgycerolhomoserine-N-methlytransferase
MQRSYEWQHNRIAQYYQVQSSLYDLSRWAFLFGRNRVINLLPFGRQKRLRILEIGCGTGQNTLQLARRYPKANIRALDLSPDMLNLARGKLKDHRARVVFEQIPYVKGYGQPETYDLILFSYCLSMIKPGYKDLIFQAKKNLKKRGCIAVADFHDARWQFYKKFMDSQHIALDAHLLPILKEHFEPVISEIRLSYVMGIWRFFIFIGQKV